MKYFIILLSVFVFILSPAHSSFVGEKGNGGDIVKCYEDDEVVYRTLDSVIVEEYSIFEITRYEDYKLSLDAIIQKLEMTLPSLAYRLRRFLEIYNQKGGDDDTLWIKAKLQEIEDESLYTQIPSSCEETPVQAIIYTDEVFKRFYYDPEQIDKIKHIKDELSWLLIHEFLRDEIVNSEVIRIVNYYLHSNDFQMASAEEIREMLKRLGIKDGGGSTYDEFSTMVDQAEVILDDIEYRRERLQKLSGVNLRDSSWSNRGRVWVSRVKSLEISVQKTMRILARVHFLLDIDLKELVLDLEKHNEIVNSLTRKGTW